MRMVAAHHTEAVRKGVKIVPCCGFDSVPSDIGTLYMVDYMQEKLNRYMRLLDAVIKQPSTACVHWSGHALITGKGRGKLCSARPSVRTQ